jgi:hypothetical protein
MTLAVDSKLSVESSEVGGCVGLPQDQRIAGVGHRVQGPGYG